MQVVINKCFVLNPEKNWRRFVLSFSRKTQNRLVLTHFKSEKNDVTEAKARKLKLL